MALPVKYGLKGQDWIKDAVVRSFVKSQQDLSLCLVELDKGILRLLRASFLYSLSYTKEFLRVLVAFSHSTLTLSPR